MNCVHREVELRIVLTSEEAKQELLSLLEAHGDLENRLISPAALQVEILLRYEPSPGRASNHRRDRKDKSNPPRPFVLELEPTDVRFAPPRGPATPT
jgi:hypothetical protein